MTRIRKGARRLSALVEGDIRRLSGKRGFSETRLLTHWAEIAGADVAAICRPVKVGYGRGGVGAVLTLLTTGAQAPVLQMQLPQIRERVNACYGYNAIARIAVTQTAPTGFAEGQADFAPGPRSRPVPAPETCEAATETTRDVGDAGLRLALKRLATNVLNREKSGDRA
ncbi:MAG: DciA family protein [Pseudomonadota bacterium]